MPSTESAEVAAQPPSDAPVRLALVRPTSWHPHRLSVVDRSAAIVSDLLYDGLTILGADGALEPGLATSWSSDDELELWTFELGKRSPGAADVVASLESLRSGSSSVATEAVLDQIETMRAVGERTVEFALAHPNGGFPWLLSGLPFSIAGGAEAPTGRYEVIESGAGLELTSVDGDLGISVLWYASGDEAIDAVASGAADVALASGGEGRQEVRRQDSVQSVSRFLQINGRSALMNDPSLRLNVAGALDVADGESSLANTSMVPTVVVGSEPPACSGTCVDESDEAVLAGRDLVVGGTETQRTLVETVADQLRQAGIPAAPLVLSGAELAEHVGEGLVDIFASGWVAEAPTLDGWLPLLVDRLELGNVVFSDGTVGELVTLAMSEADDERRWVLLREAELSLLRTGTVIPVNAGANGIVIGATGAEVVSKPDGTLRFGPATENG